MKYAVEAKPSMSDICGSMSHQIPDKTSFSFNFPLYLCFSLLEHTPFREISVDYLNIVVFVRVVNLYFSQIISSLLDTLVYYFKVIIIVILILFRFREDSFLYLQFGHFETND